MRYDLEKRTFMVKKYHKFENCALVKRAWRTEFKHFKAPDNRTILDTVSRFEKTGSINSFPPLQTKPSEKRENAKNQLKNLFSENPSLSIRKASSATEISYGTVQTIFKEDLHLKPYKYQECHCYKKEIPKND